MKKETKRGAAWLLLLFFLTVHVRCTLPAPSQMDLARNLATRATTYLWAQQSADGGWHSQTHGLLKSGQALTPFILHTLLQASDNTSVEQKIRKGLQFIRSNTSRGGVLGAANPQILEYPNYATSYGLRVLAAFGSAQDSILIKGMYDYLIDQQFDLSRSIPADHVAFGGWGFGEQQLPAGQVGYVDLSHTRRVLQSLRAVSLGDLDTAYSQAKHFLDGLQNRQLHTVVEKKYYDGGFHYSPVNFLANKGSVMQLSDEDIFLSYATATCDGLLALAAIGIHEKDPAVVDALNWLATHDQLAYPEGIPQDNPAQWHRVMFFYHLAVRAEVYATYGWPPGTQKAMLSLLDAHIREDGSFYNVNGAPNKENDPLLATALALSTLQHIINSESTG